MFNRMYHGLGGTYCISNGAKKFQMGQSGFEGGKQLSRGANGYKGGKQLSNWANDF